MNGAYNVVPQSLPLLLLERVTEAGDELVQFISVAAQELLDVLHILQTVWGRDGGHLH